MNPQSPTYGPPPQGYPGQAPEQPVKVHNPLSVLQPGEENICEIKRHPIGIFSVYVMSGLVLIVAAVIAFVVAPRFITTLSSSQVTSIGALLFFVVALLIFGFVYVASKVYWGNRWILTSDSITQVTQTSLFDKQSSQLSLGNLEDVTAMQDGILPHMFNYGVLKVETAGERSKFQFLFCPNPNYYAKQVLGARERFEQGRRGMDEQRLYREQGAYQQPAAYGQPMPPQGGQYGQPYPPSDQGQPQGQPPYYQQPQTNPLPPYYDNNGQDPGVNVNTQ